MKINIAIDGPGAAGKSTIAKRLAKQLNYVHLDTGAMYRCCGYQAYRKGIDINDENALSQMMETIHIQFDNNDHVFIDGEDVTTQIRSNENSMRASSISQKPIVREKLVELQREIAKDKGFILDGRDIGSVVLKDAEFKIYLIASVESRAQRRYKEYLLKNEEADLETISKDLEQRDYQDMNREFSPLCKAKDAIEVDTSNMNIEEVVNYINELLKQTLINRK